MVNIVTKPNLHFLHVPPLPPGPKRTTARQSQSPFFRLPLELRRLILREAFGGRTIHIYLRPPPANHDWPPPGGQKKWSPNCWPRLVQRLTAEPASDEDRWAWGSCYISHSGPANAEYSNAWSRGLPAIVSDAIEGGPCCWTNDEVWPGTQVKPIRVMGFLLSCQRAYGEALFILYTTNIIALQNQHLMDGLLRQSIIPDAPRLTGHGMRLVTSLQLKSPLILWSSPPRPDDEAHHGALFVEQLKLLPRAFPNLWSLTWIVFRCVYELDGFLPPRLLDDVEERLLRPLLRFSTTMPSLRRFVVPLPYSLFFTVMLLEQQRPEGRQNFLGQRLGEIRMWYPFTVSPGTLEPDGGGFWLVFGEEMHRGEEVQWMGEWSRNYFYMLHEY